jgi:hypothetical protein
MSQPSTDKVRFTAMYPTQATSYLSQTIRRKPLLLGGLPATSSSVAFGQNFAHVLHPIFSIGKHSLSFLQNFAGILF